MPLDYVVSTKGRLKLVFDGYLYFKDCQRGKKVYWRCEKCKSGCATACTARLHTENEQVTALVGDHNHPRDQSRVNAAKTVQYLKMNALTNSDQPIKNILQQNLNVDQSTAERLPQLKVLERTIQRLRQNRQKSRFANSILKNESDVVSKLMNYNYNYSENVGFDTENDEFADESFAVETRNELNNAVTNLYKQNTSSGNVDSGITVDKNNDNEVTVVKTTKTVKKPIAHLVTKKRKFPSTGISDSSRLSSFKRFVPTTGGMRPVLPAPEPPRHKDILIVEPSSVKFSDVGGCEEHLLEICKMVMHLKHPDLYRRLGVKPPRGFLLHGPPGCGKTLLAYAIAGELDLPFLKIAAPEIISGVSGDSEQKIRDLFTNAASFAPCLLFLDEIDAIAPRRETAQREMERRIVAQLLSCLDDLERSDKQVMIIGTTSRPDALDPALRRAGRFDKEIGLGMPNEKSRQKILEITCKDLRLEPDFDTRFLSRLTPGYVGADLSALTREACVFAINRVFFQMYGKDPANENGFDLEEAVRWLKEKPPVQYEKLTDLYVKMGDFMKALKTTTPSAKREGFATVPDVTWEDVGALASVRDDLKWSILYPIKHPEAFDAYGLSARPQGILLCGPPGCGKTLIAKAVANESGMNFISVKGPELLSMYVGESERAVRQVFQRAVNSSPCVIFFDELDALCPTRSDHESGGTARVVNQLLTEMDGIESRKLVFIIGATNRPDIIDPAILRPGRLDKVLYVGFPTIEDKVDILRAITKNRTKPPICEDCDFGSIAGDKRAEFYTGADLAALVHEAATAALKENMQMMMLMTDSSSRGPSKQFSSHSQTSAISASALNMVSRRHFEIAFNKVRPSVGPKERENFMKLRSKYEKR